MIGLSASSCDEGGGGGGGGGGGWTTMHSGADQTRGDQSARSAAPRRGDMRWFSPEETVAVTVAGALLCVAYRRRGRGVVG